MQGDVTEMGIKATLNKIQKETQPNTAKQKKKKTGKKLKIQHNTQ